MHQGKTDTCKSLNPPLPCPNTKQVEIKNIQNPLSPKTKLIPYQLHNTLQSHAHEQKTISSEDLKDILCIQISEKTEFLQFANEDLVLLNCQQLAPLKYNW
jgi:hypothetical protein